MSMLHGPINAKAIHTLLRRGEDINGVNKHGKTPLMEAAELGRIEAVRLFLEHGAAIEYTDGNGWTALLLASLWHHPQIVRLLLEQGANPQAKTTDGWTALMLAAWPDDLEPHKGEDLSTLQLLLDAGVEVNAVNEEGLSALHLLAQDIEHQAGHEAVALLLLNAGADVNLRDRVGQTALGYAQKNDHRRLIAVLKQAGAKV